MAFTPTDPTKAEVRITGTAPNQQLDFYIPRGAKGEPGGWTASIVIAPGTSLNDVVTSGLYLNPQSNVANGPSNSTNGGHLEVIATAGYVYQRYTPIAENRETYVRHRTSGLVWSAWSAFNTTRVDQTAGRAIYQWDDLNNREQLIYGDTGNRSIGTEVVNGTIGSLFLRRNGSTVELVFNGWSRPAVDPGGQYTVLTLSYGFRPQVGLPFHVLYQTSGAINFFDISGASGIVKVLAHPPAGSWSGRISFQTADNWPTTLPGVASGSIPNL